MKNELLRLRIEDPFAILGICICLNKFGYNVVNLHFFDELNLKGFLQMAELNKWIDVIYDDKIVCIENGDRSYEDVRDHPNPHYKQIIFESPEELFEYIKLEL